MIFDRANLVQVADVDIAGIVMSRDFQSVLEQLSPNLHEYVDGVDDEGITCLCFGPKLLALDLLEVEESTHLHAWAEAAISLCFDVSVPRDVCLRHDDYRDMLEHSSEDEEPICFNDQDVLTVLFSFTRRLPDGPVEFEIHRVVGPASALWFADEFAPTGGTHFNAAWRREHMK